MDWPLTFVYAGSYIALHSPSFECKHFLKKFFNLFGFWEGEFIILMQKPLLAAQHSFCCFELC